MNKLVVIQRIFPVYRRFLFDKLSEHFDFLLIHGKNHSGIDQITERYSMKVDTIQYARGENKVFLRGMIRLLRIKPQVVIHEFGIGILSMYLAFLISKIISAKFIFWGHCYDRTKGFSPGVSMMDWLRLFLLKRADAVIFYSDDNRNIFSPHLSKEKLFVAQNTLNTDYLLSLYQKEKTQKSLYRHPFNFVFIGRMIEEKQPRLLLQLLEELNLEFPDQVAMHFIGDGPEREQMERSITDSRLANSVFFYGAINDDVSLATYLTHADLMIMPGYLGLSVVHAFSFGCPVLSFQQSVDGPFHSPEVAYVDNKVTGYLAKDFDDMLSFTKSFISKQDIRDSMMQKVLNKAESELTVENMLKGFKQAVKFVLKQK